MTHFHVWCERLTGIFNNHHKNQSKMIWQTQNDVKIPNHRFKPNLKIWLVNTRVVWTPTWIQEITVSHQAVLASNFLPTVCFETLRRYPSEMKSRTAVDLLLSLRLIKITSKGKASASRRWRGASQIHLHPQLTLVQLTLRLRKALITRGHKPQGWAKSDSGALNNSC